MHTWIRTLTERKLGAAIFTHRTNAATRRGNLQGDDLQGRRKQQINPGVFFRGKHGSTRKEQEERRGQARIESIPPMYGEEPTSTEPTATMYGN
jgi:hypothetical protein